MMEAFYSWKDFSFGQETGRNIETNFVKHRLTSLRSYFAASETGSCHLALAGYTVA